MNAHEPRVAHGASRVQHASRQSNDTLGRLLTSYINVIDAKKVTFQITILCISRSGLYRHTIAYI